MQRLRRWGFVVLAADFVLMAVLGAWLAFRYPPGGNGISSVHAALGIVAVLAALAAAIGTVGDDERSTAGVLPAVVVLAVVAGMYVTGPSLRWTSLAASEPVSPQHGVVVAFDSHVGALTQGNKSIKAESYRRVAWLHAAALPVALLAMGGAGIWATRRRRTYVARHAAVDDER